MPQHRQATTGGLEHAAPLERDRGTVRIAEPALGAAIGRLSLGAAAAAQQQASGGLGWLGSADRDLRDGLSRRHSRPRDPPLGVRVRRAPARRSGGVRVGQADRRAAGAARSARSKSPTLPCLAIHLGRTRTGNADEEGRVLLVCPPVEALREWLGVPTSRRADSPGDRPMGLRGEEGAHTAVDQSDRQAALRHGGGWSWRRFSAHGRRAEYLTGAARRGIAPPEAMQQSQHRSVQQTASYYNDAERAQGRAAGLGLLRKLSADNFVSPYCRRHS